MVSAYIPIHPLLLDRFRRVCMNTKINQIPDLGIPPKGTLRPMISDFSDGSKEDYLCKIWAYDRTLKEWLELIEEHTKIPTCLWPFTITQTSNVLIRYYKQGKDIEDFFYKSQKLRWIARKFVYNIRRRIMNRRVIGSEDLYTCEKIPLNECINVFDTKSRTKFQFHTNTIIQVLQINLLYQSYGFPEPQIPKNPYTNIPFHIGQLMSIIEQISYNKLQKHAFLPHILIKYRTNNYDIGEFQSSEKEYLTLTASVNYLNNTDNYDTRESLLEAFDSMADILPQSTIGLEDVRNLISKPDNFYRKKDWIDILTSYWIFMTHHILYKYKNIQEIKARFMELLANTIIYS